jgi:hypothetical protein
MESTIARPLNNGISMACVPVMMVLESIEEPSSHFPGRMEGLWSMRDSTSRIQIEYKL